MELKILKYCRELKKGIASTLISGAIISSTVPMQSCSSQATIVGMQSVVNNGPKEVDNVSRAEFNNTEISADENRTNIREEEMPPKGTHHVSKILVGLIGVGLVVSTATLGVFYDKEHKNYNSAQDENRILQAENSKLGLSLNASNAALGPLTKVALLDALGSYNTTVLSNNITRRLQEMGLLEHPRQLQTSSLVNTINSLTNPQAIGLMPLLENEILAYIQNFNRPSLIKVSNNLIDGAKKYLSNNCASLVATSNNNCNAGQFYGIGSSGTSTCLDCPDSNAKSCAIVNGTVVQSTYCDEGYYLDNTYSICTKCNTANCANCNLDGSCNYCTLGFYNNNGVCNPCNQAMPGCHYCSSATKCISCFDQGLYISTNSLSCVPCSSIIPGCNLCQSHSLSGYTTCSSCDKTDSSNPLFVHPTGIQCNSCSSIIANCNTCSEVNGKSVCTVCTNNNYNYLSQDGKQCDICQNVIPGCTTCVGTVNIPVTCNSCDSSKSLFLTSDSKNCGLCSERFQYCTSCTLNNFTQPTCIACMTTLYPNQVNNACLPCGLAVSGCTSCTTTNSGVTQCSTCGLDPTTGTQLFASTNKLSCVPCATLNTNCATCNQDGICSACITGFHLNTSGVCVDKKSVTPVVNTSLFPINGFAKCSIFATVSPTDDTYGLGILCSTCDSGSRISFGACIPCTDTNCKTCNAAACSICKSGHFLGSSSCTSCSNNCDSCTSSNVCTTCEKGYKLESASCRFYDHKTSKNVSLPNVKKLQSGIIIDCGSLSSLSYYPTVGNSDCGLCSGVISNCNSCSVNSVNYVTLCNTCDSGFAPTSNLLSCVKSYTITNSDSISE